MLKVFAEVVYLLNPEKVARKLEKHEKRTYWILKLAKGVNSVWPFHHPCRFLKKATEDP